MTDAPLLPAEPKAGGPLSLLAEPGFRRVWLTGGLVSTVRWIEFLAIGVYVFQVTHSASLVVLFTMARLLPMALLGAVIGALAERLSQRRLLLGVIGCGIAVTATQAMLAWAGRLELWQVAIGALCSGAFWAIDMPVRRLLLIELAGAERTAAAMGLDSATSNATRMLGPSIGGLLLEFIGIHGAFLLGVVLYAVAYALLRPLNLGRRASHHGGFDILVHVRDGARIVAGDRALVGTMIVTVIFNVFVWPVTSMVPVIGESRLHLSAFPIGLLMSADGLGALVGAILVAHWARPRHFRGLYFYGVAGFALSYIVFALSPWPALGGAAQIAVGLASAGFSTMQTTIVFLTTPAGARSRAIGLLSVCVGTSVLGFLHLGLVTDWLGPQGAIVASSLEGLLALALTARVWPEIRPRAPFVQR